MAALEKANRLNPKDAETFCAIGRGFLRQVNAAQATKAYAAALREDPDSVCGKVGQLAVKPQAATPKARAMLQTLSTQAPRVWDRASASALLARLLLLGGALKEARHAADQSVTQGPLLAEPHAALGQVLRKGHEDGRAREELAHAVQLDPGDAACACCWPTRSWGETTPKWQGRSWNTRRFSAWRRRPRTHPG